MDVLLLAPRSLDRFKAEELLTEAGHRVHACFATDTWGCVALEADCPVEHSIDVAVTTPDSICGCFDPQGVVCSWKAGIPLVAIGAQPLDAVLRYADEAFDRVTPNLVEQLERVVERHKSPSVEGAQEPEGAQEQPYD